MSSVTHHAPPRATSMIESLRGLGYSPATALADIIDNGVSAGAQEVRVLFQWAGAGSSIAIVDDGRGMTPAELLSAMRLGERSPLDARSSDDLGRFGLGLKTASFSQCRRLTVASSNQGEMHSLRWDLDAIARSPGDGWYLQEGQAPESSVDMALLRPTAPGTVVLWEELDRIVTPGFKEQDFLDLIDSVQVHLEMVFHRYLSGSGRRLRLLINGRELRPWDPFLQSHPATWSSPEAKLPSPAGLVVVQCHVLPHRDRLEGNLDDRAAGPEGWAAQQGFYVYRNERLLVAGSWLGLGRPRAWSKEEAHRLARIRVDIPNTADSDWKIDIRKSMARPPVVLREHLTRLAEDTRERARRVFATRGVPAPIAGKKEVLQAWRAEHFKGGMRYRIDESHPAVRLVLEQCGDLAPDVRTMLRVIEETIPVQRIWLDTTEARETPRTGFSGEPPQAVVEVLKTLFKNMVQRKGMSPEEARERLRSSEPFNMHPQLVDQLGEHQEGG